MGQLSQGTMTLTWCYTHEVSHLCEMTTATSVCCYYEKLSRMYGHSISSATCTIFDYKMYLEV